MKNNDLINTETKTTFFFPYDQKTKKSYFGYLGLSSILSLFVVIFSLFATINVSYYHLYDLFHPNNFNYPTLSFFYTPVLCLITITISMLLLVVAPKVSKISAKTSSIMFYFAFWSLIFSVMLSSAVQISYISQTEILENSNYHWINPMMAKIFIVTALFLILLLQLWFWIMRRKFTFMPSDYEIYTNKSITKKNHKLAKKALKNK